MTLPWKFIAGAALGIILGVLAARAPWASGAASDKGAPVERAAQDTRRDAGGRNAASGRPAAGRRGGRTPAVTFAEATSATIDRTIDAIGTARSAKSVTLTSEVSGVIKEILFRPGEAVEAGDILIRVDDEAQQIALARARAQYPIIKENADRFAGLLKQDAASSVEAESALNALQAIEADIKAAAFDVSQRRITAPFDGVPGLIAIEPGDYVSTGTVLTTLDDDASLVIEFLIPQEAADAVSIGQSVNASPVGAPGDQYVGVITAIDSRIDAASRTLRVEGAIANADRGLKPGATLAVSTTREGAAAVSAPGLAVQWDRQGPYIWRVAQDGLVQQSRVIIRQRNDNLVLLEGDIAPSDIVIVEGADRVRPGMRFRNAPQRSDATGGGRPVTRADGGASNGGVGAGVSVAN